MSAVVLTDVSCHRGGRQVLEGVSLEVRPGSLLALVGPNGAGKSTLLSLMCGDLTLASGEVLIDGQPLGQWSASDLARVRSVLLQSNDVSFSFTAREVVEMGRNPWTGRPEADEDESAVVEAMRTADVTHLGERPYSSLSGGERARVSLARVLAQRTPIVLLDEPTASLDLRHQEDVMTVARELAHAGRAVIVVLHDLSLAAAYADEIAVIADGTLGAVGPPAEVLTAQMVSAVYGIEAHLLDSPDGHRIVLPRRQPIATTHQEQS